MTVLHKNPREQEKLISIIFSCKLIAGKCALLQQKPGKLLRIQKPMFKLLMLEGKIRDTSGHYGRRGPLMVLVLFLIHSTEH